MFLVTGNRFCIVYSSEQTKRLFVVYEIDEVNKKVNVKNQFVVDNKVAPTAIIAIKDKVFLVRIVTICYSTVLMFHSQKGFPGQVGFVDLSQPSLSLNLFHNWDEQTWGASLLKTSEYKFDLFG